MITEVQTSHFNFFPILPILSSSHNSKQSLAEAVIITNYQLSVSSGKIIEDFSTVANLNRPNVRQSMTGISTLLSSHLVTIGLIYESHKLKNIVSKTFVSPFVIKSLLDI